MSRPISAIVKEYRTARGMGFRPFAEALSEDPSISFSHMTISQWENGAAQPNTNMLLLAALRYSDWRRDFAFDCLAAINPGVFQPATEIGRKYYALNG